MKRSYALIVFDWDGTLMDSVARIVSCMQSAAKDVGLEAPSMEDTREIIGLGLGEAVASLFEGETALTHGRIVERYREHFLVLNQSRSQLFPGVERLLGSLSDVGYLLAVATGKSRRGLARELEETGLGRFFHDSRCADETFSKPHPRMLEELMEVLGVGPEETLMVGDTAYDIQMAANAGADSLGVTYGVHSAHRLLESGALGALDSIDQLNPWLASKRNASSVAS